MADAAASNKRPVEEGAQREREEPPSKSIKFAADTKPPASSVGFKLPASHVTSGASASAAAAPTVHANQKVGEPVDLDGGYRCTKTGRWIGNGTWKPLWNGIDVGSWEGSYWYGIPDDQQQAYRQQEQEKAAAKRAADAAAAGAE